MATSNYWTSGTGLSRRRVLAAGTAVAAAAALAACGSKSTSSKPSGSSGAAQGAPKAGGKLATQVSTDPFNWDTTIAGKSTPNGIGMSLAYDTLLSYAQGPDAKYEDIHLQPGLAARYEVPDATTFTFHLRPGLKFAPLPPVNGRDLTSADVKWSFEYSSRTGKFAKAKQGPSNFDWLFDSLSSVETPDPYTVTVKFERPFVPFLTYSAYDYNDIFPHELVDQYGDMKDHMVGSGPWQLDEASSQKGSRWVFKRNPNYWDSGKPYIDEIDWLVISDISAVTAAFTTRQLDDIAGSILDPTQTATVKKQNPNAVTYGFYKPGSEFYLFQKTGPMADTRVRQAIGFALNRDEIIKTIDGGDGLWAMAGSLNSTFTQDEIKQILKYDPQQATQLLAAAGYGNGLDLELIYPGHDLGDAYIAKIQLVQSQLKNAGINLKLTTMDHNSWNQAKRVGKFQVVLTNKAASAPDVDSFLYGGFYSTSASNYGRVNDPQLDALLTQQRQEVDPAKRKEIVKQALKLIATNGYSFATDAAKTYEIWQPHLKGWAPQYGVDRIPVPGSWIDPSV